MAFNFDVQGGLIGSATPGDVLTLRGSAIPGGGGPAVIIDNMAALTGTDKVLSLRSGGTEKAFFDLNGALRTATVQAFSASLVASGTIADSGAAIAITLKNSVAMTQGKIVSVQGNATEVLAIHGTGKFIIPTGGAAAVVGSAVLVAGTVTVATTAVSAASLIILTRGVTGGTVGDLSVGTKTAGTSFVINSANAADTSTINWLIIN